MNLKKNAESLSFIIYGLFALSFLFLYNGFSTLYGNALADFIMGERQNVLLFQMSYGNATTLILIGSLIFFGVRYITSKLEKNDIISPENTIRFWILGGILLVGSLFTAVDLFISFSSVMTGQADVVNLLVLLVTLTILVSIIIFCISELKRKQVLKFLSPKASLFLIFCMASFVLGFFIAPPWSGRDAREDQKQLQRMQNIKVALSDLYTKNKGIPDNLSDIRSDLINKREDITDLETKKPYEYKKIDASSYELCGHFLTSYELYKRFRLYPQEFKGEDRHKKGRTCYTVNLSLKAEKNPSAPYD